MCDWLLQNHEQSSKAQTWLLCLCWRFLSIRSARVGHLTFVLQKYQQYLSVEWRWNARKLGSTGQQISARPGQFTILGWIILISEHDVAACDPTYQSRRNSYYISSQTQHGWHWTLAQIQETKPNQSTPRQTRKKTPARPRHRALTSQTSENNLSHRLFNAEQHEYHFEVFYSHSRPPSNTLCTNVHHDSHFSLIDTVILFAERTCEKCFRRSNKIYV